MCLIISRKTIKDEISNSYSQKQICTNSTQLERFLMEPIFQSILNISS